MQQGDYLSNAKELDISAILQAPDVIHTAGVERKEIKIIEQEDAEEEEDDIVAEVWCALVNVTCFARRT